MKISFQAQRQSFLSSKVGLLFLFVLTDAILLNLDLQKRTPDLDNFSTVYTFAYYYYRKKYLFLTASYEVRGLKNRFVVVVDVTYQ